MRIALALLLASMAVAPRARRSDVTFIAVPGGAFALTETEITVAQFRKFVAASGYVTDAERGLPDGENGKGSFAATPDGNREWHPDASWRNPFPNLKDLTPREDHPVVHVSWNDARAFCAHYGWRLPTEAEWETACRAGGTGLYPWGDDPAGGHGFCNAADAAAKARFPSANVLFPFDDGFAVIAPAGRLRPNAWGFHDMIGNVEEWCADVFRKGDPDAPASARVMRGGTWLDGTERCRVAQRSGFPPTGRRDFLGFRAARSVRAF